MKWFIIGLIGVVSCLLFILILAPASLLVSALEDDIAQNVPEIALGTTEGSVWQGTQQLQYRTFPALVLQWDLSVLPLLTGTIDADNQLTSDNFEGEFSLRLAQTQGELTDGNLVITGQYLNHVTVPLGLDLSETFTINDLNLAWVDQWVTSISGIVRWPGGIVHIETPEGLHTVKMPALEGTLSLQDTAVRLQINDGQSGLMEILLKKDGWVAVAIDHRLITMIGIPFPDDPQADTGPAVLLEEKVF